MKRKFILIFMAIIMMGVTACSSESKEDAISMNTDSRQETNQEETADTKTTKTKMNDMETSKPEITQEDEITSSEDEEIPEGDPIAGIVEEYEGNIITVRTPEDDMIYHFSTENVPIFKGFSEENAMAAEGDFQIAIGDKVEVSYRGLLDDEKHPIEAVKIVVITVE